MKVTVEGLDNASVGFEPLPPDTYIVIVTSCQIKESSTGNPMVSLEAEVAEHEEYNGRKLFWNISLVEKAAGILKGFLVAANVPISGNDFNTEDIMGQILKVTVTQEEYNGEMRNQVKKFFPTD